ncbi:MAG: NAD(P)(+) transhydrogenase (Re/Si-specific) subunit beta [Saprospirales bacterium]|nr:NAD(P)(+) transhydrogenase (Re/Si-specific) subunit beta [Saprospirales bacterium]
MGFQFVINLAFMVGAILFVWGLRLLSSPDSARRGNLLGGGIGMALAIVGALFMPLKGANNYVWIFAALAVGGVIGYYSAKKVKMTSMPQMVSIFNGLGGACAVLLAMVEFYHFYNHDIPSDSENLTIVTLALIIGGVAFTGSMIAFAKLEDLIRDNFLVLPKHSYFNIGLAIVMFASGVWLVVQGEQGTIWLALIVMTLSLLYGVSFVVPIGGADMPVVISLLNSFSGLSAASAGLIYNNQIMVVGGILVGASGTILTVLMCNAMNRSLLNVLVGGFGGSSAAGSKGAQGDLVAKEVGLNDMAIQLNYSKSVVFVPGYGLAVAQAQKVCKEIEDILEANGVEVRYAIHPVAGRMPGHMNVLLAEADVPYPKLLDLEDANSFLANADMAVIVGANDVVNPAALDDPSSPIYGMPILRVWDAKHVIVLKRSMRPGYAGIENPLFFHPKTRMLFGDAKESLGKLVTELKNL